MINFEPLQVQADLKNEERSMQILDLKEQQLKTKTIPLVKVLWQNHDVEEASWELEQEIKNKYHICLIYYVVIVFKIFCE
jgi:hypothetical protein